MTNLEILQNSNAFLNRINNMPLKNQNDIAKLRKNVSILNKAVIAIIKTLLQGQQDKVKDILNGSDTDNSPAK